VLLKPDRVFDAAGEATHAGWVVLVRGDSIAAVGPAGSVRAPSDAETINLPGLTLLPGLIDAHSHLFLHPTTEALERPGLEGAAGLSRRGSGASRAEHAHAGLHDVARPRHRGAGFEDVSLKRQ
jgi:imidazolonepropionase-like amidohydrolase